MSDERIVQRWTVRSPLCLCVQELTWQARKQDSRKRLSCRVSTESPTFSVSTEQLLLVRGRHTQRQTHTHTHTET